MKSNYRVQGLKKNLRVRVDRVGKAWIIEIILDQRIANQPEIGLCWQANSEDRRQTDFFVCHLRNCKGRLNMIIYLPPCLQLRNKQLVNCTLLNELE